MGFAAFCYAANKEAMREYRFSHTVLFIPLREPTSAPTGHLLS